MSISKGELQDAARRAFGNGNAVADTEQAWERLVEMGWLGICVPEDLGGLGLGREAQAVIHFELGRILGPGSIAVHLATIDVLVAAHRTDLIERAIAGELMTASMRLETGSITAGTISGCFNAVPDADRAQGLVVAASDRIVLMPLSLPEIAIAETAMWDRSRRLFQVTLDQVPVVDAVTLASGEAAIRLWDTFNSGVLRAVAADSLGGADAMLGMTLDYLGVRRQFDRPLAMFQALKHRCADMKAALAGAEALLWADAGHDDLGLAFDVPGIGALKAHAARVYHEVVEEAVQLHGGIGLTQEHACHRYLKRALLNETLGGSADIWEEALGRRMLAA